jgi:hypothetical protein
MSLDMERMAPELVVHALPQRQLDDNQGICDYVWACVLNDYLDTDNTEYSDDNSISTAEVLRAERRKMKKMKKRESKLRRKLADNLNTISEVDAEHDDGAGLDDVDPTAVLSVVDSVLENRDAFESLYNDVMNTLSGDNDQSRDMYLPPSVVQQKVAVKYDDHPELKDALVSKTIHSGHLLDSGEPYFSTREMEERGSLIADALARATPNPNRKETHRSVHERETLRMTYEVRDNSRSLHERNRDKIFLGLHDSQAIIQPPAIATAISSATTKKNSGKRHKEAIANNDAIPKRIPVEPVEQIPSNPSANSAFKAPRSPRPDGRIIADTSTFHDGSKDNPIDIVNGVTTSEWRSRRDLLTDTEWQHWKEKKFKPVTRTDPAEGLLKDHETSRHRPRTELLTTRASIKKRDLGSDARAIDSPVLLDGQEGSAHDITKWAIQESNRNEMDDIRRKRLDRKEALIRIQAIKARIAQLDP